MNRYTQRYMGTLLLAITVASCSSAGDLKVGDSADDAYAAGQRLEAEGDFGAALRAFEIAIERNPHFVPVRMSKAYLLYRMDRPTDALAASIALVALDDSLASNHELVAELSVALGDHSRGEKAARRAIQLEPNRTNAYLYLAQALDGQSRLEETLTAFEDLLKLDPSHRDGLLGYADVLRRLNLPRRAIEQLKRAVKEYPDEIGPRRLLGAIYIDEGTHDRAVEVLVDATNIDGNDAVVRLLLGRAYLARGQEPLAVIELQKAIALNPDLASSYVALGEAEFRRGYRDRALDYVRKALTRDASEISAYLLSARVKEDAGDLAGAETDLRKAVEIDPQAWPPARALAGILKRNGRAALAVETLAPFASETRTRRDAAIMLADLVNHGAPPAPALKALERAHKAQPDDDEILALLIALALDHPEPSIPAQTVVKYADTLYQRAGRDRIPALILFARAIAGAGDTDRARQILEAAGGEPIDPRVQIAIQDLR
jgi:tetratricopeptide (TPR) repeat protein